MNQKLLSEIVRIKEIMEVINEQVVTDYDSKYDYKKENDKYFVKRKNSDSWSEVKGGTSLDSIKSKVFGVTSQPKGFKDTGYSKTTDSTNPVEVPFKNREEGDKFRVWVNDNYPNFAKKIDLDKSGSHNNKYIKMAWGKYGNEYEKKYINVNPDKKNEEEGFFMNLLRKTFPFLVQLIYSKNLTNSDFSSDHFDVIKNVVKNAKKRIPNFQYNKIYGTQYIDYSEYTKKILDTRGQSWWDMVKLYVWESDNFEVATTLGRFSFKVSENGEISIYDEYDFTKQYDITREDLDWENTNTIERINKILELGNGDIGIYGAIRHIAYLNNPQGGINQSLTVNLTTKDTELANIT